MSSRPPERQQGPLRAAYRASHALLAQEEPVPASGTREGVLAAAGHIVETIRWAAGAPRAAPGPAAGTPQPVPLTAPAPEPAAQLSDEAFDEDADLIATDPGVAARPSSAEPADAGAISPARAGAQEALPVQAAGEGMSSGMQQSPRSDAVPSVAATQAPQSDALPAAAATQPRQSDAMPPLATVQVPSPAPVPMPAPVITPVPTLAPAMPWPQPIGVDAPENDVAAAGGVDVVLPDLGSDLPVEPAYRDDPAGSWPAFAPTSVEPFESSPLAEPALGEPLVPIPDAEPQALEAFAGARTAEPAAGAGIPGEAAPEPASGESGESDVSAGPGAAQAVDSAGAAVPASIEPSSSKVNRGPGATTAEGTRAPIEEAVPGSRPPLAANAPSWRLRLGVAAAAALVAAVGAWQWQGGASRPEGTLVADSTRQAPLAVPAPSAAAPSATASPAAAGGEPAVVALAGAASVPAGAMAASAPSASVAPLAASAIAASPAASLPGTVVALATPGTQAGPPAPVLAATVTPATRGTPAAAPPAAATLAPAPAARKAAIESEARTPPGRLSAASDWNATEIARAAARARAARRALGDDELAPPVEAKSGTPAAPAVNAAGTGANAEALGRQLRLAADRGDVEALRRLLSTPGAAVDATDASGRTPLLQAVLSRRPGAVRTLLGAGADPARPDRSGLTPQAAAQAGPNAEIARMLGARH